MIVDMPDMPGVYRISCKASNKFYIGCSQSMSMRFMSHYRQFMKGAHPNKTMQGDWDKYGHEHFEFAVIEVNEEFAERELYWLKRTMSTCPDRMYNRQEELVTGARDKATGELRKGAKIKYQRNQFTIMNEKDDTYFNFKTGWQKRPTKYGNVGLIQKTIAQLAKDAGIDYWKLPDTLTIWRIENEGATREYVCDASKFWEYRKGLEAH